MGNWIDGDEHINVAATTLYKPTIRVIAANIDGEGFSGDIDFWMFFRFVKFDSYFNSVKYSGIFAKIAKFIIYHGFMNSAKINSIEPLGH